MKRIRYQCKTRNLAQRIFGIADDRIHEIESLLNIRLIPRGDFFYIEATFDKEKRIKFAEAYLNKLQAYYFLQKEYNQEEEAGWKFFYTELKKDMEIENTDSQNKTNQIVFVTERGRSIQAKGKNQQQYVNSIIQNPITIGIGPAGTGKTFLSIAAACHLVTQGKRNQMIITRPAVEAGESLGFLPGDLEQKIDPYLRPLYDSLYECLGRKQVNDMIGSRQIEIAPLAYMRGRTLNNAVVLLDEGQNCTTKQLKMILTRLGRNTSICLSGDVTQVDLAPGKSGLMQTAKILFSLKEIEVIYFTGEDIVRNLLVEKMINAFDTFDKLETKSDME